MKSIIRISLCITLASTAGFADVPQPPASPKGPAEIHINPETLRKQVLQGNLTLTQELNKVKDAKDQVGVSRANLFPSVNIGGMLASGGTSFLLSSVQFLLPFLMPSNWFDWKASKSAFDAEKYAYQILELNTYSSALSLYLTMVSDLQTQKVYDQTFSDLSKIYDIRKKEIDLGTASPSELLSIQSQAQMAGVQASQLGQLAKQEVAALRAALGFPLSTNIIVDPTDIAPSEWEQQPIQAAVTQANKVAPEHLQIQDLVKVAKSKKWSAAFGFINGTTLAGQNNNGNNGGSAFSNLTVKGNVSLGFALYPTIKIANRNIQEVQLLDNELVQSNTQVLEAAMNSLLEAKAQFDLATQAESEIIKYYKVAETNYNLGVGSLTDILYARSQVTTASVARIRAALNLNLQRTVIHRALLTDQFSQIKGCDLSNVKTQHKGKVSIDQLCREQAGLQTQK